MDNDSHCVSDQGSVGLTGVLGGWFEALAFFALFSAFCKFLNYVIQS